jgi:hypothetical protein
LIPIVLRSISPITKEGIWIFYEGHNLQYFYVDVLSDKKTHFYELLKSKKIIDKYDAPFKTDCLVKYVSRDNFENENFYYEDLCFAKNLSRLIEKYFVEEFKN